MVRSLALAAAAVVAIGAGVVACGDDEPETTTVTVTAAAPESEEPESASSPAVAELQQVMTTLGFYSGPIDGVYGEETTAAVEAMQADLGVTADGIYGAETHAALKDKAGNITVEIQTVLAEYGYYTGEINGNYGPETVAAVEQLQEDLGVTVDGRVGPETIAAFEDAVESGELKPA